MVSHAAGGPRKNGRGRFFNQEAAIAAHPRAPFHTPPAMAPPPLPERRTPAERRRPWTRRPSSLQIVNELKGDTTAFLPFKVKSTNGRSVVGTRVWLPRSSPFTSGRVYGLPDSRVYGFQMVSPYWRESARAGRLPACLGGDLDISGARETSLRQNNRLGAKVRFPEPGKVTLPQEKVPSRQGSLLWSREGCVAAGNVTSRQRRFQRGWEHYFGPGKVALPRRTLLRRREGYFEAEKFTLPSGRLLCRREGYFAAGQATL